MKKLIFTLMGIFSVAAGASEIPKDFVYLRDIDPSIIQDIRYAGSHNFVGHPLVGYEASECLLTRQAALALSQVQKELLKSKLSLQVYDCYRPVRTVKYFMEWAKDSRDNKMKKEFYPKVNKKDLFVLKYVAEKSGHSRGSTVDLSIVHLPAKNTLDMGTDFDYMDEHSHAMREDISIVAYQNRGILRKLMEKYGFKVIPEEWWHFSLVDEPFSDTYFDFPITKRNS